MKRKTVVSLSIALVLGLVATAVAWAGPWRRKMDPDRVRKFVEWRLNDALDELDANDKQRARIKALSDPLLDAGMGLVERRPEVREAILEAWTSEKPDAARVHQLVDDRIDEIRALAHQAVDAGLEVHRILTPEQRGQVADHIRAGCHQDKKE